MSFVAPTRLAAFQRTEQYRTDLFGSNPTMRISDFIKRFDWKYFQNANKADSSEFKELRALWLNDQRRLQLNDSDYNIWVEYFRRSLDLARIVPRLK